MPGSNCASAIFNPGSLEDPTRIGVFYFAVDYGISIAELAAAAKDSATNGSCEWA
jgi:hypothetical protein